MSRKDCLMMKKDLQFPAYCFRRAVYLLLGADSCQKYAQYAGKNRSWATASATPTTKQKGRGTPIFKNCAAKMKKQAR
jgi:hypothetical protein